MLTLRFTFGIGQKLARFPEECLDECGSPSVYRLATRPPKYRGHCLQYDFQVHPNRPILNVLQVEHYILLEGRIMARADLPKSGNAGEHVQATQVRKLVLLEVVNRMGTWTDNAHVSFQHVEDLGQFVNAITAEQFAHGGNSRIVGNLERGPVSLVHVTQIILLLVGVNHHGAEFEAAKLTALASYPPGTVEHRP